MSRLEHNFSSVWTVFYRTGLACVSWQQVITMSIRPQPARSRAYLAKLPRGFPRKTTLSSPKGFGGRENVAKSV